MVVIVPVLRAVSMKRCSDVSFAVIKNSEASLECFENLSKRKILPLGFIGYYHTQTLQRRPQLLEEEGRRGSSSSPPKMSSRPRWGGAGKPSAPAPEKGKELEPGNRPNPGNPAKTSPKEVGLTTMTTGLVPLSPSPESKGGISSTSELSASSKNNKAFDTTPVNVFDSNIPNNDTMTG